MHTVRWSSLTNTVARSTADTLTIGKLAKQAGVGVETIRFYEREKLLPEPARDGSGYRRYPASTVRRLRFIGRAKELGFTLRETRELLEMRTADEATCITVKTHANTKLEEVRLKVRDLQRIEAVLVSLIDACPGTDDLDDCPILAALDGDSADD